MRSLNLRIFLKLAATGIFILVLSVFCAFIYGVPNHPVSIFLFKVGYRVALLDRHTYLQLYSPWNRDVNAGSLPIEVDEFLCDRMRTTDNPSEFAAIVDLYSTQAHGRQGDCVYKSSEGVRQKVISQIVSEFDDNPKYIGGSLILLREAHFGTGLGKGGFAPSDLEASKPRTPEEWNAWSVEKGIPIVKAQYRAWWQSELNWDEKKTIDPMKDTLVRFYYCCG
jgi:hypothetical protein